MKQIINSNELKAGLGSEVTKLQFYLLSVQEICLLFNGLSKENHININVFFFV